MRRPLLDATVTVSEYCEWRIADTGTRYYLVSNKLNVFNQAGKQILTLDTPPNQQPLSEQTSIVKKFRDAKHVLNGRAEIEELAQPDHWWIEDDSNRGFR